MEPQTYEEMLRRLREEVGPCRDWPEHALDRCGRPAEYVLWGKLIPPEGLGPRCYDCAAKHIGHHGLAGDACWALINLARLARELSR